MDLTRTQVTHMLTGNPEWGLSTKLFYFRIDQMQKVNNDMQSIQ
jgi:hypothetical protein